MNGAGMALALIIIGGLLVWAGMTGSSLYSALAFKQTKI